MATYDCLPKRLSNLDAKLRMALRAELKRIHCEIKATAVYVTHDQLEALTLSTRIAVMKGGVLQQYGSPQEIYHFPANLFVTEFMGNPTTNLLPAVVVEPGPPPVLTLTAAPETRFSLPVFEAPLTKGQVILNVRPEDMRFHFEPKFGAIPATVYASLPTGAECIVYGRLPGAGIEIVLRGPEEEMSRLSPNQPFWIVPRRGNVFDPKTGRLLCSFGFRS